ncbi:response regulator receiver domain/Stage II sporulation protein E [Bellilinea caldifistulae]|uniref:SpoIIE family protein phosphatase n=1 Tax=Bellilinea caldifistulae TaxID=360411 RepID=UPI00078595D2|nr:SpoIIE family protein phosphatase [Bellilinea caldifistulae]GAP11619.1 response regulator receiver domain/Stage II sporulation protein E [Bellilinea caldifistulae]
MNPLKSATRVALASDQAIYRKGLSSLIMSIKNFQLVGEAQSVVEIVELCKMTQPTLVLLDFKSSAEQAHYLVNEIHSLWPTMKIVLLLDCPEETLPLEEFGSVPLYLFSRDVNEEEFKAALLQVERDPSPSPEKEDMPHPVFNHSNLSPFEKDLEEAFPSPRSTAAENEEFTSRELAMAGKIQADILPEEAPHLNGWEIVTALQPARETSGDFYDFIPLSNHKMGFVVADVSDKGMGAALFMALSSSLFRTYAVRFPTLPAITMSAVSERILSDTRGNMFVTAFFGILEPLTGRLTYANAGHPPGFLISVSGKGKISLSELKTTGMALGVSEQARWTQKTVRLSPGDLLILYTDGITEAQNEKGEFFGEDRLLDVALAYASHPAAEVHSAILNAVHHFVGHARRSDDIALIVVRRQ